nr:MAG TPA: hypothetical protein [Caudoviricetes sp.]
MNLLYFPYTKISIKQQKYEILPIPETQIFHIGIIQIVCL